ncbi:MAG: ABC transporter permease subunit [Actinobacteria bacterium]|nr:ABC transporter permease subunit [Actinomycetota bacterium]
MNSTEIQLARTEARARRGKSIPRPPLVLTRVLLAVPIFVLVAIFLAWPLLNVLLRSLSPTGVASYGSPSFDLGNYGAIFSDTVLRNIVIHTFVVAAWATAITTLLAFPVAYLLSRLSRRLATVILALIMIPFWISILIRLFAFTQLLGREGVVNSAAEALHLGGPYSLLFNTTAVVIGMVAYLLPYMILILYGGMSGIDPTLTTAAKTLGASGRQAFRTIYMPLVRPALIAGVLLIFVLSLGFFLTPAILGGATDTTIPIYIQQQVEVFQWGKASATGILLLAITVVGFAFALRLNGTGLLGGRPTGKGMAGREPLRFSPSTALLWVATGLVLVVLLLPLVVIVPTSFETTQSLTWPPRGFTMHWYGDVLSDEIWTTAILKSFLVALGTAILSTAIALVLARTIAAMRQGLVRAVVEGLVFAPLVVPVILLAVGIYDVETRLNLIGTNGGLIFAHTMIAFPLAYIVLSGALANVDPALEQAAWTLGASRARTFWTVVIPNILSSLFGALVISFVTSWDEVVIALFQTSIQKTLPVTIFSDLKSGVQPSVAAIATLLVAVVVLAVAVGFVISGRRHRGARATAAA